MSLQSHPTLRLFEAFGLELEYMIVDAATFQPRPICDQLIHAAAGAYESEIERSNGVSWSNELVNHVVELKTSAPVVSVATAAPGLSASVVEADALLAPLGARLMPGGMHPWMDPARETTLWPHEYSDVYQTFDRLFNCRRHGWANLQSVHLNLPFNGDQEFGRLHAAVRLILPLLPALCASSPFVDGHATGILCNRMAVYRDNQAAVPSLTGQVIPEPVFTHADYQRVIMEPIERDVARLDPSGLMRPEWMNSRGAIARFDRGSIEIRVMDVQEHPGVDAAIAEAVIAVLKWLVSEAPSALAEQQAMSTAHLRAILDRAIVEAERTLIDDPDYLDVLGFPHQRAPAVDLWRHLLEAARCPLDTPAFAPLRVVLLRGPLARRMLARVDPASGAVAREELTAIARDLSDSLRAGRMFE